MPAITYQTPYHDTLFQLRRSEECLRRHKCARGHTCSTGGDVTLHNSVLEGTSFDDVDVIAYDGSLFPCSFDLS